MKLFKRPGPLAQLTLALVLLTGTLVLMADVLFNALPGRQGERHREHQRVAQMLSLHVASLMSADDGAALRQTLAGLTRQMPEVRSVGIRRADGALVAEVGSHHLQWRTPDGQADLAHQFTQQLASGGRSWGQVEVAFVPDERGALMRWLDEPAVKLLGFVTLAGALSFGLYMRRALQHLDPASVIPDRVQRAFDVMNEGVVVLDSRGRVMLVNTAFKGLHPEADAVRAGQPLSGLPWLGAGLPADVAEHPWNQAIAGKGENKGTINGATLEIGRDIQRPRQLLVNCAPITDPGGTVRGCLATFDDVSALHRANAALQQAMAETQAAREEVERKNTELLRLATRDPLTGCLNRRALYEALAPMWEAAKREGTPLACLMLDIDHFKSINDRFGHGIGDRAIQEVARCVQDSVRTTDLVCRYGGEEFCVIVPGLHREGLLALAERIRSRIQADCGPGVREVHDLEITASVGCEPQGRLAETVQQMIDHADQALYSAKRGGRNRVRAFEAVAAAAADAATPA